MVTCYVVCRMAEANWECLPSESISGRAKYHSTAQLGAGPETGPHLTDSGGEVGSADRFPAEICPGTDTAGHRLLLL